MTTKVYISAKQGDNKIEYLNKVNTAAKLISALGFDPVISSPDTWNKPEEINTRLQCVESCTMIYMLSDWRMCEIANKELNHFLTLNKETKFKNVLLEQENGYIQLSNYAQILLNNDK
jgi:hypothetical protein